MNVFLWIAAILLTMQMNEYYVIEIIQTVF